jgi:hypothetical protein
MTGKKQIEKDSSAYDEFKEFSKPLLQALHLLTVEGRLNQDARRKIKQVKHLIQFITPHVEPHSHVIDVGSGKSYLGFLLCDLILKNVDTQHVHGLESRQELVEKCRQLANDCQFKNMSFWASTIKEAIEQQSDQFNKIDLITALHACDTATDEAIDLALKLNVPKIFLVPCCQAEMARHLRQAKNTTQDYSNAYWAELWKKPLHTREFGSHLTNVLRCLRLESHGYHVTVTELTGWEHSLKNELIVAIKKDGPSEKKKQKILTLLRDIGVEELSERFW